MLGQNEGRYPVPLTAHLAYVGSDVEPGAPVSPESHGSAPDGTGMMGEHGGRLGGNGAAQQPHWYSCGAGRRPSEDDLALRALEASSGTPRAREVRLPSRPGHPRPRGQLPSSGVDLLPCGKTTWFE